MEASALQRINAWLPEAMRFGDAEPKQAESVSETPNDGTDTQDMSDVIFQ